MFHRHHTVPLLAAFLFAILAASTLPASEAGLVSTMELMAAVSSHDGIQVVPAADIPNNRYTGDFSPSQVLEIIRPNQEPVAVGRLATSCTCLSASISKREFAQGERALIEVRNIKPTQPSGATYAIFVQLTSPVSTTLEHDMFVQSESQPIQGDPVARAVPASAPPPRAASPTYPIRSPQREPIVVEGEPIVVSRDIIVNRPPPVKAPPLTYEDIEPYTPKPRPAETPAPVAEDRPDGGGIW